LEDIMRRRTFDALLSTGGLVLAAVLLIAGVLLTWGHNFADSNVHTQLASQKIFFPTKAQIVAAHNADISKYVTPYAGQQVTNGTQAEVFANHYIANHLKEIGQGKTYSQVSEEWLAMKPTNPQYAALGQVRQTLFMGETLRGLLLNAYAFSKLGAIAGIGAIVSFIGAGVMFLLAGLGFVHRRRTAPTVELDWSSAPAIEHINS
jgi:hypothetical protein